MKQASKIKKAKERLKKESGVEPAVKDLAEESGVSVKAINKTLEVVKITSNILYYEEIDNFADANHESPEEVVLEKEVKEILHAALESLSETEKKIIARKFGFINNKCSRDSEIAEELNMKYYSVRRDAEAALKQIRDIYRNHGFKL